MSHPCNMIVLAGRVWGGHLWGEGVILDGGEMECHFCF